MIKILTPGTIALLESLAQKVLLHSSLREAVLRFTNQMVGVGYGRRKLGLRLKTFFLWLVLHNKIPTALNLVHRNVIDNSICQRCYTDIETTVHAIRDCTWAQQVWNLLNVPHNLRPSFSKSAEDWLHENVHTAEISVWDIPWSCVFTFAVWSIWLDRKKTVIKKENCDSLVCSTNIKNRCSFFIKAQGSPSKGRVNFEIAVRWHAPPENWFKLNCDGSANLDSGRTGIGGVIRKNLGNWVIGYQQNIGKGTSLIAEITSIREG